MTADASAQQQAMAEFRIREKQRYLKKLKETEDGKTEDVKTDDVKTSASTPNSKASNSLSQTPATSPAPARVAFPTPVLASDVSSHPKESSAPTDSSTKKRSVANKPKMKEAKAPEPLPNESKIREADSSFSDCLLSPQPDVSREAMPIRAPTVTGVAESHFVPRRKVPHQQNYQQPRQAYQPNQHWRVVPQQAPTQPASSYTHNSTTWRTEGNPVHQHFVTSQQSPRYPPSTSSTVRRDPGVTYSYPAPHQQHQQQKLSQIREPASSSRFYQPSSPSTQNQNFPQQSSRPPTQHSPCMPSAKDMGSREPIEILDDMEQDPDFQKVLEESMKQQYSPKYKPPQELTEEEQLKIVLERSQHEK
eukprot:GHVP01058739.1.p1 GENE.GHVP01058739.1~~GHVP01058739.1.p1  ORF type:complete len:362 (+),score=76.87 GHVP01058739.1:157-1242(+)